VKRTRNHHVKISFACRARKARLFRVRNYYIVELKPLYEGKRHYNRTGRKIRRILHSERYAGERGQGIVKLRRLILR
jgi:hypothetical protein